MDKAYGLLSFYMLPVQALPCVSGSPLQCTGHALVTLAEAVGSRQYKLPGGGEVWWGPFLCSYRSVDLLMSDPIHSDVAMLPSVLLPYWQWTKMDARDALYGLWASLFGGVSKSVSSSPLPSWSPVGYENMSHPGQGRRGHCPPHYPVTSPYRRPGGRSQDKTS